MFLKIPGNTFIVIPLWHHRAPGLWGIGHYPSAGPKLETVYKHKALIQTKIKKALLCALNGR